MLTRSQNVGVGNANTNCQFVPGLGGLAFFSASSVATIFSLSAMHDPSVARAAHRILRIEDGVIKMALTPSEVIVEEKAVSYTDQLKARINELNKQLLQLDKDFKAGKVTGDEYTEQRTKLKQTLGSLQEELSRMGMVT